MAKKAKRGRPRLPRGEGRGAVLTLRMQPIERRTIESAARKSGGKLSDWMRVALLRAAAAGNMEEVKNGGGGSPTPSA